jgi:SAM-dependent methyltransferase
MHPLVRKLARPLSRSHQQRLSALLQDPYDPTDNRQWTEVTQLLSTGVFPPPSSDRHAFIVDRLDALWSRLPGLDPPCVVDVGGGDGHVLHALAQRHGWSRDQVHVVDPAFASLDGSFRYTQPHPEHVTYHATLPELPPESVTGVVCMVSWHHMDESWMHAVLFPWLRDVARTGCVLWLKEHDVDSDHTAQQVVWEHALYHALDGLSRHAGPHAPRHASLPISRDPSVLTLQRKETFRAWLAAGGWELRAHYTHVLDEWSESSLPSVTHLYWDRFERVR